MTKTKIRNCPWCENKPLVWNKTKHPPNIELWYVACIIAACPVMPSLRISYLSKEEAVRAWNKKEVFY